MSKMPWRSKPDDTTGMPKGIPYIIGNELAERFSFYGMRGILTVFMTAHLLDRAGNQDFMSQEEAKAVYHLFVAIAYFFPIVGAIIADVFWGKYKTILLISLMYCVGHGMLALMDLGPVLGLWDMKPFMYVGLLCIAVGAGGIKSCVSAHVGDQFGKGNKHLLTQIFNWFYFSINVGAATSSLLTPIFLAEFGPWLAFGVPGVLMALATFMFWMGRHKFIHIPPAGWQQFKEETFSPEGKRAMINLAPLFLVFVPMFWVIFDQTGSAWVLQADKMDRQLGILWLPSQIQAVNPLLILIGIPLFTYGVYPLMGKFFNPTPLRKIGIGLMLTAAAFVISGAIETKIESRQIQDSQGFFNQMVTQLDGMAPEALAASSGEGKDGELAVWSRSAMAAADVGGVDRKALAELLGMGEAELEAQLKDGGMLTPDQIRVVFEQLAVEGVGDTPKVLNAAVSAARVLGEDHGWDEETINGKLSEMPNVLWQFIAYIILTSAEIMVSIVCLEFAYTQAPKKMKSFIMGVFFLGVFAGNLFTAGVNFILTLTEDAEGNTPLVGANYYWFFAGLMLLVAFLYIPFALNYKGQTYIQGEDEEDADEARARAEGTEQ